MTLLPLSPSVFAIFQMLIEAKIGLHYEPEDRELLAGKLSPRALDLGFESLLDYYYFLRYDPAGAAELEALAEVLVVGETYFFREADQLRYAVNRVIVPAVARGERPRLWCAASSTGEEPLTLAMLLAEAGVAHDVDFVASDVSARSLAVARQGRYSRRSIRTDELPAAARPYLTRAADGSVTVSPDLVRLVDWRRINLLEHDAVAAVGERDLIFCRNVLIYFREPVVRQVLDSLQVVLRPAGTLLVGVSESLLRFGTALVCEEADGVFFYRRRTS